MNIQHTLQRAGLITRLANGRCITSDTLFILNTKTCEHALPKPAVTNGMRSVDMSTVIERIDRRHLAIMALKNSQGCGTVNRRVMSSRDKRTIKGL